jgi:NTP pyrophosphatase (non-canonical NTP hydrolase)
MSSTDEEVELGIKVAIALCHGAAVQGGWWTNLNTGAPLERNVPEMLCLIHSEVSEALEGYRKNLMDDKLPHRSMLEVEMADTLIRIFDLAGGLKLDLAGALLEKLEYNKNRADHKIENRKKEGGKKI